MSTKVLPHAFVQYDCSTPPNPLHFRDGVMNSFEDLGAHVHFLNKFYQCLLAAQIPLKIRKLVVCGPKDSGKTSSANIFHRLIPTRAIASITNERQFSAAMLTRETQLVIIDDWSPGTMDSELAKTLLQGGWIVTAMKHSDPRQIFNHSPFYVTTNEVP